METSQLNIRLATDLKREGDATLARCGVSATEAIRSLWQYLASAQKLPGFMRKEGQREQGDASLAPAAVRSNAAEGQALALRLARQEGLSVPTAQDVSYYELRDLAFEEMLEEGRFHA